MILAAVPVFAIEGLAVIDYQTIFDQYEGTSDAQQTLNRELKDWDEQAKTMRDEITALGEELESQRLMLSEERLREKRDELDRKKDEYERFAQDIWGVNGKAAKRNAELTSPIAERILDVIAKLGEEMGLDVVLDAGTGGVVWAKDDANITDTVLEDLRIAVERERDAAEKAPDAEEAGDS
ncbi:OmpH family outer membrane protein [bacterium]|nr:OmpH family outer membrane protein [bacterium]